MPVRHFLTLGDLTPAELQGLLQRARQLKQERHATLLAGRSLALLFEQPSTRTRVAFEAAMHQLGGGAILLTWEHTQLGRGESLADTARVLSRMVDAVVMRTAAHARLEQLAQHAEVPVINGLSDACHPCQLLADVLTYVEHRGSIRGRRVAWLGDGNNVCRSYVEAAGCFDFQLCIACPESHRPPAELLAAHAGHVELAADPAQAVRDADLVVTDVWASMGDEAEAEERLRLFRPFQVHAELMRLARADALFMHCLPAKRGLEVTAEVIDGAHSVVWDEAGNRLHAQKALLEFLLAKPCNASC